MLVQAVLGIRQGMTADISSVTVDGTAFVVALGDGRVMRSPDLVGVVLTIATNSGPRKVRVDAVERDPAAVAGPVWLHSFSVPEEDGSWRNLCEPDPKGRRQGFPLGFRARQPDGAMETAPPGEFELTCTAGVHGKCIRFGYLPWQGEPMRALYNGCIRMMRADYCGDGEATTRNGTVIDFYDDYGIQTLDEQSARTFEAGWTAAGAVCIGHVRIKENISLDALVQRCPRLRDAPLGANCTEERARSLGAILFNRSLP